MAKIDIFFDTNILLYLADEAAPAKQIRSKELLTAGGTISVQVLNEVTQVMRRKWKRPWPDVHAFLKVTRGATILVPVTEDVHAHGLAYAERYKLQVYDSMIVAAAVLAGCRTLYSEDMHAGLVIDGLTIRNPYAVTA